MIKQERVRPEKEIRFGRDKSAVQMEQLQAVKNLVVRFDSVDTARTG